MSMINRPVGPSPAYQALKRATQNTPKKLTEDEGKQLRKAILSDGKIDHMESALVDQILQGKSSASIQELSQSGFSPKDLDFDSIAPGARKALESLTSIKEVKNARESVKVMQDKGFIELQGKNVSFDFEALENYPAKDIEQLMDGIEANPNDARKYKMLTFMLQGVGATLKNPQEKASFIQDKVLSKPRAMSGMSAFTKAQPMDVVNQALRETLKHSNEEQTLDFLKETGFILENQDVDSHWDIRPKALEHLPADVLQAAHDNISDSFFGDRKYARSALQRMIAKK